MSADSIAIVWNPAKTSKDDLEAAVADAAPEGAEVSWIETTEDDPGRGQAEQALADGATLVIAAGGDGTVRGVAEALADADTEADLGIVPLGTGNLLARNLEIPLGSIPKAVARAITGEARTIDLAWADAEIGGAPCRHAFTVMAGVGVDAHMITETDEDLKGRIGWLAYVESLGRAVNASDVIPMGLAIDGSARAEQQAHTLIVGNCGILTGGITLLPDADPADGELDMLLLSADGVAGWLDTMRSMVWDNGLRRLVRGEETAASSDSVTHRRVRSVTVDLGKARVLELDGDEVGETSHVVFTIQPGALRVRR
ncbi:diacylglycerol kinase family protein [Demequina sp. NBRC 110057]|uniref:diacylglycerol/lipid kinase family protein n=1 Tax=Demequina sp. NBRC 110057 TaxID=1570346 RepID=UPI000A04B19A|nr:diacylglycerol kinase family protein [Demequina sp. NBRC 110057]